MFKIAAVICAVLLVATLVAAESQTSLPVPFVFWSARAGVASQNVQSLNDVANLIDSVVQSEQKPRAIISFIYSKLGSAEFSMHATGRFSSVKSQIQAAASSVIAPNLMTSGMRVSDTIIAAARKTSVHVRSSRIAVDSNSVCIDAERLITQESLPADIDMFTLMYPENVDLNAHDDCMTKVLQLVNTQYNGNIAVIVSSDSSTTIRTKFVEELMSSHTPRFASQAHVTAHRSMGGQGGAQGSMHTHGVKYQTPILIFALLFGLMFLVALLVGLCSIMSVQVPLRFPARKIAVNKEY